MQFVAMGFDGQTSLRAAYKVANLISLWFIERIEQGRYILLATLRTK